MILPKRVMAAFSIGGGKRSMTKGMRKYFKKKIFWFIITFIAAVVLNFILPRLMPGDPVNSIVGKNISPGATQEQVQEQITYYKHQFGLDKSIFGQFWDFVKNAFNGTFGVSYSQYPRLVSDIIGSSIWWTVALQLPAILVGWLLGNLLGALAAYKRSFYDKALMPLTLFFSAIPAFGASVILLVIFAVTLGWAPVNGAFDPGMIPGFNWKFISSVIAHYQLPFWSIVLISIGGQAVGMRSMSIYELNADYVKYARFLGIKDKKIVRYVFRNAMLPQVTGLAMSIGSMVGGALVAETIFSYPGLGMSMYAAINSSDYPVISACTLIITIMVLIASFMLDIIYAFIDPRVKAAQFD